MLFRSGFPDVSFHGVTPGHTGPFAGHERYVGVLFSGWEREARSQVVYVASNAWWEDLEVVLPALPAAMRWELAVDTWQGPQCVRPQAGERFLIHGRSVMVFVGK